MAKLDGKVAIITGAAVGLGEAIAEAYAKYGAKLCMVDLSKEVENTAERLRKEYGTEIITCVANVADKEQMKNAVKETIEKFGRVDIACCNAGEAAYAMTKAALVGLTKCLAIEYADRNIRVNCSQLGYARTQWLKRWLLNLIRKIQKRQLMILPLAYQ